MFRAISIVSVLRLCRAVLCVLVLAGDRGHVALRQPNIPPERLCAADTKAGSACGFEQWRCQRAGYQWGRLELGAAVRRYDVVGYQSGW